VTDQYLEASSAYETLLKNVEVLRALPTKATSVDEKMTVQKELIHLEQEYDRLTRKALNIKKKSVRLNVICFGCV